MPQPQAARISCTQCNGWYSTENELRDHMRMAHRTFLEDPNASQPKDAPPASSNDKADS